LNLNKVINANGKLITGFYIALTSVSFKLFLCYPHPGSDSTSLNAFPDIACYGDDWTAMLPVTVVLGLGICTIGFYSLVAYLTYVAPRRVPVDMDFQQRYKFIWGKMRADHWWYTCVLMSYGVVLNLVSATITSGALQLYLMVVILFLYSTVGFKLSPWVFRSVDKVDTVCRFCMILVMIVGTAYAEGRIEDDVFAKTVITILFVSALMGPPCCLVYILLQGDLVKRFVRKVLVPKDSQKILEELTRIQQVFFIASAEDEDSMKRWLSSLNQFDEKEIMSAMDLITAGLC